MALLNRIQQTAQPTAQKPAQTPGLMAGMAQPAAQSAQSVAPTPQANGQSDVIGRLTQQLRSQNQGQTNWNVAGVDRADEFARVLASYGVNSLDGAQLETRPGSKGTQYLFSSGEGGDQYATTPDTPESYGLRFGDGTTFNGWGRVPKYGYGGLIPLDGGFAQNSGGVNEAGMPLDPQQTGTSTSPSFFMVGRSGAGDGQTDLMARVGQDGKISFEPLWGDAYSTDKAAIVNAISVLGAGLTANAMGLGGAAGTGGGLMGPPIEAAGGLMGPPIEAAGMGLADASAFSYAMPGAEAEFGLMNAGAPEAFTFNAAADSQAANAAMQAAGTPTGAAVAPSGVNLVNAGGIGATNGLLSGMGQVGDAIYSGLGSIGTALKNNPGLASAGASLISQGLSSAGAPKAPSGGSAQGTIDAQSKANMDAALLQAQLNRVDTVNPLGSTRYNAIDDPSAPGGKRYEQVTSLAPGQQRLFDATQSSQIGQAQLLDALTKRLGGEYGNPLDFSSVPGLKTSAGDPNAYYDQAADAMYSRALRYLEPEQQQATRTMEARLAEQGFVPGTPAYAQAMRTLMDSQSRARGDARDSALLQGLAAGQNLFSNNLANANLNNTASGQTLAQLLQKRAQPLNELNAVRSGTQVQVPSAAAPSPVSINAVDVAGINNQAYQNQLGVYNANVASNNAQTAAMGQLGTALLQYFSDERLKDDIRPFGKTPGGANLYTYTIFGRPEVGVLAQELLVSQPAAVSVHESGFFIVDYSKVR